jgi:uncharacterized damage-inducible protein DinB
MMNRPARSEASEYYFRYIDQVKGDDVTTVLEQQLEADWLWEINEEQSLYRAAPDKWSIRQVLNHLSDAERVFAFRAFWFARGFDAPLPSFEQETSPANSDADDIAWRDHVEEFRSVRAATLALLRNLPAEAWQRTGTASGNLFSVRALAYIVAGHTHHHFTLLREQYLYLATARAAV